jgi:hypothetical protein
MNDYEGVFIGVVCALAMIFWVIYLIRSVKENPN